MSEQSGSIRSAALMALGCCMAAQALAQKAEWKPVSGPLLTRWAKEVSPERVRPEYPRPQFVRKAWMSLNGLWQFAFDDAVMGRSAGWQSGKELPQRILVPFPFEAALSGIGKGTEIHERVWYRRAFDVPKSWGKKHVLLHFGAVDWDTTVWGNGKEVWKIARIRGVGLDDDVVSGLTLKAGKNILVVKVGQGVSGWGVAARFELPNGKELLPTRR